LSTIVGLPLAPLRVVLAVGRVLRDQAEQELYNPAQVRRQLEEIDTAQVDGSLSGAAAEERQQQAVDRLLGR
jgi:hypothetical protein